MRRVEVVVVGAGPAGLSAGIAAAEAGAEVLVIDEYPQPGGQIYAQTPQSFRVDADAVTSEHHQAQKLLKKVRSLPVEFLLETVVWGVFDGRQLSTVTKNKTTREFWAETLILAPGAYERPVPFPGWTLPGVMTAGGLQKLVKLQWVLPGKSYLLVGTGPLQLVVASQLVQNGAHVVGIADASSWRNSWQYMPRMLMEPKIFFQGLRYFFDIYRARIPFLKSHAIIGVEGNGRVERAITSDVDENWHPLSGTERTWKVDTVCVGYGFVSSVELAALAGCHIRYEPKWNSWVPEHDRDMKTSVPGVYVAGDGAGLGGAIVAVHEGHVAGVNAAMELGYYSGNNTHPAESSYRRLQCLNKFRDALDRLWHFKPGLHDIITDDTIICRCEEITYADVKEAIAEGAEHVNQVKAMTRVGMGLCQGRFCEVNIAYLLKAATGISPQKYTIRPPVKPLPVEAVVAEKQTESL
jgi:NADPH-dependent 2,4-dienoyl-CoA reductase/sulfur reductase-like enzyme